MPKVQCCFSNSNMQKLWKACTRRLANYRKNAEVRESFLYTGFIFESVCDILCLFSHTELTFQMAMNSTVLSPDEGA
jgi:hypothetical protein